MPVRFVCPSCQRLLSVATRKVGSEVACPACKAPLVVPAPEEASEEPPVAPVAAPPIAAADVAAIPEPPQVSDENPFSKPMFFDEALALAASLPTLDPIVAPPVLSEPVLSEPALITTSPAPQSPPVERKPDAPKSAADPQLISFPRRVLYLQAVLLALLMSGAVGIGFVIGRGAAPTAPEQAPLAAEPISAHGKVTFRPAKGSAAPDGGAVVIAIPQNITSLKLRISTTGLRPEDRPPLAPDHATLKAIDAIGGQYTRANPQGVFELHLTPGEYHLLAISNHAKRPAEASAQESKDLSFLGRYFENVSHLLGAHSYEIGAKRVAEGESINFELGLANNGLDATVDTKKR